MCSLDHRGYLPDASVNLLEFPSAAPPKAAPNGAIYPPAWWHDGFNMFPFDAVCPVWLSWRWWAWISPNSAQKSLSWHKSNVFFPQSAHPTDSPMRQTSFLSRSFSLVKTVHVMLIAGVWVKSDRTEIVHAFHAAWALFTAAISLNTLAQPVKMMSVGILSHSGQTVKVPLTGNTLSC